MDEFTSCSVCARTLIVGERIGVTSREGSESYVCELCVERPRALALGEIVRVERIRSRAAAISVRS